MSDFELLIPLRIDDVCLLAGGVNPSTIYRWMKLGKFPKSFPLGPAQGSGSVGWDRQEVFEWLQERKCQR